MIIKLLRFEEGFRSKPYKCTAGRWTIGFGYAQGVTENTPAITRDEAEKLLMDEVAKCVKDVSKALPWSSDLDMCRRDVLVSMRYQLGMNGLLSFSKFLREMRDHDFDGAAAHLKDSKFYSQTTNRVKRLIGMLHSGEYPKEIA